MTVKIILVLIILEAGAFVLAMLLHLGASMFGLSDSYGLAEGVVQGSIGLLLAICAYGVWKRTGWARAAALLVHGIGIIGALFGMWVATKLGEPLILILTIWQGSRPLWQFPSSYSHRPPERNCNPTVENPGWGGDCLWPSRHCRRSNDKSGIEGRPDMSAKPPDANDPRLRYRRAILLSRPKLVAEGVRQPPTIGEVE
jgi:hypothetical protein